MGALVYALRRPEANGATEAEGGYNESRDEGETGHATSRALDTLETTVDA